jgi:dihydrofolate reductase
MSLDGYIAGPNGEADWITPDPDFDFRALYNEFDTLLVGRKTFEVMASVGRTTIPGMETIVFSRTLRKGDHPEVMIVSEREQEFVAALKSGAGKDIWLFGGGALFRTLSEARLVDTVEVSVMPVVLGSGVPLLPGSASRLQLVLDEHTIHRGIVSLKYAITSFAQTAGV